MPLLAPVTKALCPFNLRLETIILFFKVKNTYYQFQFCKQSFLPERQVKTKQIVNNFYESAPIFFVENRF
jgi:hypothetical protein